MNEKRVIDHGAIDCMALNTQPHGKPMEAKVADEHKAFWAEWGKTWGKDIPARTGYGEG